jgi:chromosome segregation ATPase
LGNRADEVGRLHTELSAATEDCNALKRDLGIVRSRLEQSDNENTAKACEIDRLTKDNLELANEVASLTAALDSARANIDSTSMSLNNKDAEAIALGG